MPTLYSIDELAVEQVSFLASYEIQQVTVSNVKNNVIRLKPKKQRSCRFCHKNFPETSFGNIAHLIPKSLGNTTLKSDFECDTCNNKFSLLETDFNSFLGIYRAFNPINDKKIKFKTNTIVAKEITLSTGKRVTWIINQNLNERGFSLNLDTGEGNSSFYKPTYIPLNVYKLFLKIGLSCLPQQDAALYPHILSALQLDNDALLAPFAKSISQYELSFQVASPRVIVLKRKLPGIRNMMHHVQIYFREFVYMLPIPLFFPDIANGMYNDGELNIDFCPPMFLDQPEEFIHYHRTFIDLSSADKTKQKETLNFGSKPENFTKLSAWDQLTGFQENLNPKDLAVEGIIMTDAGVTLNADEMTELQTVFKQIRPNPPKTDQKI